jgi:hypothetical protein
VPHGRKQAGSINSFVHGYADTVDVLEIKAWNVFGVLLMFFGVFCAVFGLLIGDLTGVGEQKRDRKSR